MNSIFSSFEILFAELFGVKVKAHVPPALGAGAVAVPGDPSPLRPRKRAPGAPRTESKRDDVAEPEMERRVERFLRFAPELDGIHCFETIVSR